MEPTLPTYKQGDQILLNGVITTVLSWPAENIGPFAWEQYNGGVNASVQGTNWVEASNVEPYDGDEGRHAVSHEVPVEDPADLVVEPEPAAAVDATVNAGAVAAESKTSS